MKRISGYVVAALAGIIVGYFAGREHLKYEMRSAFESAAEGISESFSSAFDRDTTAERRTDSQGSQADEDSDHSTEKLAYIAENLELYDVSAKYMNAALDGRVPGVLFKIKNTGERSLDKVEVTIYFKDAQGRIIAEEDYHPVLVSEYSFSGDNKPLKPGYIWQMEQGKFYSAKKVPDEWAEGQVNASITDIEFSE